MTDTNKLKIKGIHKFVKQNNDLIIEELSSKIPYDSIVNYRKDDKFYIYNEHFSRLRIQTSLSPNGSAQAHVYISDDDTMQYLNRSKIVMDIIIDTYKRETRDIKLEQLGI